jgi:hypothetical protein
MSTKGLIDVIVIIVVIVFTVSCSREGSSCTDEIDPHIVMKVDGVSHHLNYSCTRSLNGTKIAIGVIGGFPDPSYFRSHEFVHELGNGDTVITDYMLFDTAGIPIIFDSYRLSSYLMNKPNQMYLHLIVKSGGVEYRNLWYDRFKVDELIDAGRNRRSLSEAINIGELQCIMCSEYEVFPIEMSYTGYVYTKHNEDSILVNISEYHSFWTQ